MKLTFFFFTEAKLNCGFILFLPHDSSLEILPVQEEDGWMDLKHTMNMTKKYVFELF